MIGDEDVFRAESGRNVVKTTPSTTVTTPTLERETKVVEDKRRASSSWSALLGMRTPEEEAAIAARDAAKQKIVEVQNQMANARDQAKAKAGQVKAAAEEKFYDAKIATERKANEVQQAVQRRGEEVRDVAQEKVWEGQRKAEEGAEAAKGFL